MALNKADIKRPARPAQAVDSEVFGGEVIVRAPKLSDHLRLVTEASKDGGVERFAHICRVLAVAVETGDKQPVFSAEEWDDFGATEEGRNEAYRLFGVVRTLQGDEEDPSGN